MHSNISKASQGSCHKQHSLCLKHSSDFTDDLSHCHWSDNASQNISTFLHLECGHRPKNKQDSPVSLLLTAVLIVQAKVWGESEMFQC